MKAIQPVCLRSLSLAAAAVVFSCGYDGERAVVRADGEIFEAVARSQLSDSPEQSPSATSGLRFDSRPAGDNTDLVASAEKPLRLELDVAADSVSGDLQA